MSSGVFLKKKFSTYYLSFSTLVSCVAHMEGMLFQLKPAKEISLNGNWNNKASIWATQLIKVANERYWEYLYFSEKAQLKIKSCNIARYDYIRTYG